MKNKWLLLCLVFLLKLTFAANELTTEKVMNVSGLTSYIDNTPILFYQYERTMQFIIRSKRRDLKNSPQSDNNSSLNQLNRLSSEVERIKFNSDQLRNTISAEISRHRTDYDDIITWYNEPLAKNILNSEITFYKNPKPDEVVKQYFSTASADAFSKDRKNLLKTIDELKHVSTHRIQRAIFFSEISAYLSGKPYTSEERSILLNRMQAAVNKSTPEQLQYQYQTLSDGDLVKYANFLSSSAGKLIVNSIDIVENSMLRTFNSELNQYLVKLDLVHSAPGNQPEINEDSKDGFSIGGYDPTQSATKVTRAAIENEYSKTPLFNALKNHHPAAYNKIIDLVEAAQQNNSNKAALPSNVSNILSNVKYNALLKGPDDLVIDYFENVRDIITQLQSVGDETCFAYVEPLADIKIPVQQYISQSLSRKESQIFIDLIRQTDFTRQENVNDRLMAQVEATDLTQGFYRDYTLFLGEDERQAYTDAMMNPNDPNTQKSYVCQLKIDYYNNFLDLPANDAAAFFRRSMYRGE